jgi:hypothetical protein
VHIVYKGKSYPQVSPEAVELRVLMELRQQSRPFWPGGLGVKTIREIASRQDPGNPDALDEDDAILLTGVMLFLALRCAGEKVTFEDAVSVRADEFDMVPDPGDEPSEVVAPDPSTPTPEPVG